MAETTGHGCAACCACAACRDLRAAAAARAAPPGWWPAPSDPCRAAGWRGAALPTPTGCWWGRRLRLLGPWPSPPP